MSPRKADPPSFEFVMLGLVRLQPSHGYELFHTFSHDHGIGMIWQTKPARMYVVLDKLEELGWLVSEVQTGEGFLPRKQYHISSAGENSFQTWLTTPVMSPHRMRQEFLARLYFILRDDQNAGQEIISRQAEMCRTWLTRLQHEIQNLSDNHPYEREVLLFRTGQVQAMLEWVVNLELSLGTQSHRTDERNEQDD